MAYETETKVNIPVAERIGKAAEGVSNAIYKGIDFADQQKKTQAYLDHMKMLSQNANQEFQQNMAMMKDKSLQSQTGLLFTAAGSEDPTSAAKMLYPRYSNFSQFTGDQSDPQSLAEKAKGLQNVLGKDRIQRIVQAPSVIGNFNVSPDVHQKHLASALSDLNEAQNYMNPDQYKSALDLIDSKDKEYLANRRAIEATTMKIQGANERAGAKTNEADDKRFNDVVDALQGRKRVGASAPYQQAQQRLSLANASEAWLQAMKTGKVVPNQASIAQLKSNIDSMVAGGSGRSVEMIKILMEKTRTSDTAQALQYVTSHPQAAASKEFLNQYENELQVEKAAWEQKRNDYLDASLSDLQDVVASDPNKAKRLTGILKGIAPGYPVEQRLSGLGASTQPSTDIISYNGKKYEVDHATQKVLREVP